MFPPDGAILAQRETYLKVEGGTLPLTVLLNGAPVATGLRSRRVDIGALGQGFARIAVVDAAGKSTHTRIEVRP